MKIALVLIFLLVGYGFSQNREDLVGIWVTPKKDAYIQICDNKDSFSGKIIWLADSIDENGNPQTDSKNSDKKLRERPLLGMNIVSNLKFFAKGIWKDGKVYDPDIGSTYSCQIKMTDRDSVILRGFIGMSLLGRSEIWKRVKQRSTK